MPRSLAAILLSAVIAGSTLTGCIDPAEAPAAGRPPTGASSAAPPPPADEPPGTIACGKAVRAVRDATLMNPTVVTDITSAAGTADAPVTDAAQRLSAAYEAALAAHNKDTEPDAIAAVSGAAAELLTICSDSGLGTVG
jgi:hypothetical protein